METGVSKQNTPNVQNATDHHPSNRGPGKSHKRKDRRQKTALSLLRCWTLQTMVFKPAKEIRELKPRVAELKYASLDGLHN